MGSKTEFVSPEGLRVDGRRVNELRVFKARMGVFDHADGSAYLEQGNTKVLAVVTGPHEAASRVKGQHDRVVIRCEMSTAAFSSSERRSLSKHSRRAVETSAVISNAFESAVLSHLYPKSQIDIYVQVLQDDGGTTMAAVNAATLAMIDAGIPMKDFVCACTVGYIDNNAVLDVNYHEMGAFGPTLSVAMMPKSKKFVMTEMESRVHMDQFSKLLPLAQEGCSAVFKLLHDTVLARTGTMAAVHGSIAV